MMQSKIKYLSSGCVPLDEEEPECSSRGDRIPSEPQHRTAATKSIKETSEQHHQQQTTLENNKPQNCNPLEIKIKKKRI